jgi:septal ring factor EnvC (AmiA/AmiB activator)
MPDQTIKEHFDTIATALDAATTRAAGYSKTIQTCMNQDKRLKSAYKRYRTEKAQLGAESQTLRAQNDRLTEIIVKNANIPKKMQEEIDDLNFRLAGLPFCLSIRDKFRDKLSELDDLDEQYRTSQSAKHFESMHDPRRIVRPEEKDTAISHDN